MNKKEKKALFKRRVSIEGAYDFELFCNYMKTKTHEIHNIRFVTPNGKLNELRLQVRSPNSQPKKKLDWWCGFYVIQLNIIDIITTIPIVKKAIGLVVKM